MALNANPTADLTAESWFLHLLLQASSLHWDQWKRWSWEMELEVPEVAEGCCKTLLSGHDSPIAHITVTVATRTKPTIDQASKNSNMDWGGVRQTPLLAEELLAKNAHS